MDTFISRSPADTVAFGVKLGSMARQGWVIGVTGDLGAGKTQLVKGIAESLGIRERIPSPTFALVIEHRGGRWPLFHLDLYRLETMAQILAAGLEDFLFSGEGLTVIEWYERWQGPAPAQLCRVTLRATSETERLIEYHAPCP
ncbi:MAG: tRNA (adenosine(37)-N6)-threonylcarbamoyltransferase complex ATPase subunit type 1 TsaE [Verrucomicrobiales bacterium]|nr:tRNA (adenosine(37)-N6)-threonylcarbamoyltransferase complex ATPase subunit type 1 TsaE [Verrucomicrobiales bacterium]